MKILLVQGHPTAGGAHFCHALADAYAAAAQGAGHELRRLEIAALDFPVLRSRAEWEGVPVPAICGAQDDLRWCDHLVLVFPLWLGEAPALVKAFLEQVLRPGFAVPAFDGKDKSLPLKGRSAQLIVTMGMPAWFYRIFYRAHGLKSLTRNVFHFVGIRPVRWTLLGMVEGSDAGRVAALRKVAESATRR